MNTDTTLSQHLGLLLPEAVPESSRLIDVQKVKSNLIGLDALVHQQRLDIDAASSAITDVAITRIASSEKGIANGLATLGSDGKIPSSQLPSYVDDIVEAVNLAAFPETGETSKIYVALDTNLMYRWSGTIYVSLGAAGGGAVSSVNNKTGAVTLTANDIGGISNVGKTGNYSDLSGKPTKLSEFANDLGLEAGNSLQAAIPGAVTPFTGTLRNYPRNAITLKAIVAWVSQVVASDLVIQVCKNSLPVQQLTIATGTDKISLTSSLSFTPSDYITINVLSGTCNDLVVRLDY